MEYFRWLFTPSGKSEANICRGRKGENSKYLGAVMWRQILEISQFCRSESYTYRRAWCKLLKHFSLSNFATRTEAETFRCLVAGLDLFNGDWGTLNLALTVKKQHNHVSEENDRNSSLKFENPIPRREQYDEKMNFIIMVRITIILVKDNQIFVKFCKFYNDW